MNIARRAVRSNVISTHCVRRTAVQSRIQSQYVHQTLVKVPLTFSTVRWNSSGLSISRHSPDEVSATTIPSTTSAATEQNDADDKNKEKKSNVATKDKKEPQKRRSRFRQLKAPIEITERAAERIKVLMAKNPDAIGVKLGVRTRGCNGLSYTMNYVKEKGKFDDVVEDKGVTVVLDAKAMMHIIGTTMDYKEDALTAEFVFENPNAKGECGCGESFNV